jgi:hypothetical protein
LGDLIIYCYIYKHDGKMLIGVYQMQSQVQNFIHSSSIISINMCYNRQFIHYLYIMVLR